VDLRVPLAPILSTFGVPATVVRPAPDDAPIATTGVWLSRAAEQFPGGAEIRRAQRDYLMALPVADLPTVPLLTRVAAPDIGGGPVLSWIVDGFDRLDAEFRYVILVPEPALS